MRNIILSLLAVGLLTATAPPAGADASGIWLDHTRRGAIEIYPCKNRLCGRIVWMSDPNRADGTPKRDAYNPSPARRRRTICGLQVLGNLSERGNGTYGGGWIYDPEKGKRFSLRLTERSRNKLEVRGYVGTPFLGKTYFWSRAPEGLKPCKPV